MPKLEQTARTRSSASSRRTPEISQRANNGASWPAIKSATSLPRKNMSDFVLLVTAVAFGKRHIAMILSQWLCRLA